MYAPRALLVILNIGVANGLANDVLTLARAPTFFACLWLGSLGSACNAKLGLRVDGPRQSSARTQQNEMCTVIPAEGNHPNQ
eukprot:447211-Amphidinium_carterae.3